MNNFYKPHPKSPLATAKYESYLRRYKQSLNLGAVKISGVPTLIYDYTDLFDSSQSGNDRELILDGLTQIPCVTIDIVYSNPGLNGFKRSDLFYKDARNNNYEINVVNAMFHGHTISNLRYLECNPAWRVNNYRVESSGCTITEYELSCNCPDFTQNEEGVPAFTDAFYVSRWASILRGRRSWAGSNAGPFNPCKHIMAVNRSLQIPQSYTGYP